MDQCKHDWKWFGHETMKCELCGKVVHDELIYKLEELEQQLQQERAANAGMRALEEMVSRCCYYTTSGCMSTDYREPKCPNRLICKALSTTGSDRVKAKIVMKRRLQDGKSEQRCECGKLLQEYKSNYHMDMPYCGGCGMIVLDAAQKYCCWCGAEFSEALEGR